jgi:hypothetical protein
MQAKYADRDDYQFILSLTTVELSALMPVMERARLNATVSPRAVTDTYLAYFRRSDFYSLIRGMNAAGYPAGLLAELKHVSRERGNE